MTNFGSLYGMRSVCVLYCESQALKNVENYCSQFHQHFMYEFFVQTLYWQLFSSYMYIEKAAELTFVQKICTENIDEIDTWCTQSDRHVFDHFQYFQELRNILFGT